MLWTLRISMGTVEECFFLLAGIHDCVRCFFSEGFLVDRLSSSSQESTPSQSLFAFGRFELISRRSRDPAMLSRAMHSVNAAGD